MNIISPLDLEWILQSAYEKKKKKKKERRGGGGVGLGSQKERGNRAYPMKCDVYYQEATMHHVLLST